MFHMQQEMVYYKNKQIAFKKMSNKNRKKYIRLYFHPARIGKKIKKFFFSSSAKLKLIKLKNKKLKNQKKV